MDPEVHELTTFELDAAEQKKSGLFSKIFQRFRTSGSAGSDQDSYMTISDGRRSGSSSGTSTPTRTKRTSHLHSGSGSNSGSGTPAGSRKGSVSGHRLSSPVPPSHSGSNGANYTPNLIAASPSLNGKSNNAQDPASMTPILGGVDPDSSIIVGGGMNRRPSISSVASINTDSSAIVSSWNTNTNSSSNSTASNYYAFLNLRASNSINNSTKSRIIPYFQAAVSNSANANNYNNISSPPPPPQSKSATIEYDRSPYTMTTNINVNANPSLYYSNNIRNFPAKKYTVSPKITHATTTASIHHQRYPSVTTQSKNMGGNVTPQSYHSSVRVRGMTGTAQNAVNTIDYHRRKSISKPEMTLAESLAMSGPTTISTSYRNTISKNPRTYGALGNNNNGGGNNGNPPEEILRHSNSRSSFDSINSQGSNPDQRSLKLINLLKNGESKQFWMPDENCKQCYICKANFNTFRRKHHCRICGLIFCNKCAFMISGEKFGYSGSLRVCNYCLKILQKYLNELNRSQENYPRTPVHSSSSVNIKSAVVADAAADGNQC